MRTEVENANWAHNNDNMSSSLIPVTHGAALAAGRYVGYASRSRAARNARVAAAAAQYAYANRAEAAKAARTIKRVYQRWKRRRTERVGDSPNRVPARVARTGYTGLSTQDTRTLYSTDVLDIGGGTDINDKPRGTIYVAGIKLCMEVTADTTVLNNNYLLLNVALVACKVGWDDVTDFFRHSGNARAINFSTALSSQVMHCSPINADKYTVLMHTRLKLGEFQNDNPGNHTFVNRYVPVRRQIRYDSTSSTSSTNTEMYLVYWADLSASNTGTTVTTGAYKVGYETLVYFRSLN